MYHRYNASQLTLPRHRHGAFPPQDDWQKRNEMKTQYSDWIKQLEGCVIVCPSVFTLHQSTSVWQRWER